MTKWSCAFQAVDSLSRRQNEAEFLSGSTGASMGGA